MICPKCLREIPNLAQICMHCDSNIVENIHISAPAPQASEEAEMLSKAAQGLNFGAFMVPLFWSIAHKKWSIVIIRLSLLVLLLPMFLLPSVFPKDSKILDAAMLICFLPIIISKGINLFLPFYMLFNGNRIAWESGRYTTIPEMRENQNNWNALGVLVAIVTGLMILIAAFVG